MANNETKSAYGGKYDSYQDYSRDNARGDQATPIEQVRGRIQYLIDVRARQLKAESAAVVQQVQPDEYAELWQEPAKVKATSKPLESKLWSYFKACVIGYTVAMFFKSFFVDAPSIWLVFSHLFLNMSSSVIMFIYAPILLLPIRVLSSVMRAFKVERGASDVFVGTICGSFLLLADIQYLGTVRPESICYIFGGAFGGFAYWQARGFPTSAGRQRSVDEIVKLISGLFKKPA